LKLLSVDGVQQAWNHDFATLDPRLCWHSPSNGTYIVQVMGFKYPADAEVRLTGGDGCVYRLHLDALAQAPPIIPTGAAPEQEPNNSVTNARLITLPASIRGNIDCPSDEDCFGFALDKAQTVEL